jgi:hypothetical protein
MREQEEPTAVVSPETETRHLSAQLPGDLRECLVAAEGQESVPL